MDTIHSKVDTQGAAFAENRAHNEGLVETLRAELSAASKGGDEKSHARHRQQNKMFVRERLEKLLDPGSPFLELGALAAHGLYDGAAPAAGIVTGIGRMHGREVMVVANDATVKGGTYFPMTVKKHVRAQEVALENNGCPASTSSTRVAPSCRCRPRSSPTAITSGGSSTTRRS